MRLINGLLAEVKRRETEARQEKDVNGKENEEAGVGGQTEGQGEGESGHDGGRMDLTFALQPGLWEDFVEWIHGSGEWRG